MVGPHKEVAESGKWFFEQLNVSIRLCSWLTTVVVKSGKILRFFGFRFLIRFAHFYGFTILHVDRIFVWIVYWSNCTTNSALFVAISERILCGCLDSEQHNNQRCHLISATILVIFKKKFAGFQINQTFIWSQSIRSSSSSSWCDVLSRDLVAGQRKSVGCLCHLPTLEQQ